MEKFIFYTININYLRFLHEVDKEVYFNEEYKDKIKPFVGVIWGLDNNHQYFIPLTSAKQKHTKWNNTTKEAMLIVEPVDIDLNIEGQFYKPGGTDSKKLHILAALDIKKMIPVPQKEITKIEFEEFNDNYRTLFEKEYAFCLRNSEKIISFAEKIYNIQKKNSKNGKEPFSGYCNFRKLEKRKSQWIKQEYGVKID